MDIWHIHSKISSTIILWKNDNANFQVTQKGIFAPLLTNGNYTIIDNKYASLLSMMPGQISFYNVKIIDLVLKVEKYNYLEVKIINTIAPDNILNKNSEGLKIWKSNSEVFVSDELKAEFLKISKEDFSFDVGFGYFG